MGALLDKIIGPDVVGALGPEPNARPVIQPQPPALGLLGRDLQPLASPDPPGQFDDVVCQSRFILTAPRDLALRRAMLPERRTGTALGDRQLASNMLDAGAPTRGAQ